MAVCCVDLVCTCLFSLIKPGTSSLLCACTLTQVHAGVFWLTHQGKTRVLWPRSSIGTCAYFPAWPPFFAVSSLWTNEQANPRPRLNCAVILPKAPPAHWLPSFFSVTSRKAKAVYPCEAEHDSELSFQVGAIFNAGKCYRLHQSLTQN